MTEETISCHSLGHGRPALLSALCAGPVLFIFLLRKYEPISLYPIPNKMEKVWPPACIKLPSIHLMVIIKSPPSPLLSSQSIL